MGCLLPTHVLGRIAINSTDKNTRALAIQNIEITTSLLSARIGFDETMRAQRQLKRAQRLARGKGLFQLTGAEPQKHRTIYTSGNSTRTPGTPVRQEGGPALQDPEVDESYGFMGQTFDFFWNAFGRNSLDDAGAPLNGSVHYSVSYDNALWNGKQMIYGDGDDKQFVRFTKSADVIGHELTHGVTQHESGLIYYGEPGALNESLSDVFGSMVKQYINNQDVNQADWLIGAGLFTPSVNGQAIRSLKAPGTAYGPDPILGHDDQPSNMQNYVHTLSDNGGVHINSGIPNNAFYRAATYIGGYSWDRTGLIWYKAMTSPQLSKVGKFQQFAQLTVAVAQQLFPAANAAEPHAVQQAWNEVGIAV